MLNSTVFLLNFLNNASFVTTPSQNINVTPFPTTTVLLQNLTTGNSSTLSPVDSYLAAQAYMIYARNIYVWLVPFMVSVLTLAIIGNGLIVISSPWLSHPISPYHRLCVSLAAADTWAASLVVTGLSWLFLQREGKKCGETLK